ncbi:hypothetical protein B0T16DRAFT_399155 [Cercophora newfieldiana]|uniref:Uncharacterized protein n=1 Tax=Cercophora newfieldiana TaxID=92897 RepID=A0AA39YPJ7_9PEZI|nr:hypothetical protein B0T16DRAFT_399155 [Cercophora newfieldiana]
MCLNRSRLSLSRLLHLGAHRNAPHNPTTQQRRPLSAPFCRCRSKQTSHWASDATCKISCVCQPAFELRAYDGSWFMTQLSRHLRPPGRVIGAG